MSIGVKSAMGLIIKSKSKLRAMQSYIYTWDNLKKVYRDEAISIPWEGIDEILVATHNQKPYYYIDYRTSDGYQTTLAFFTEEVENLAELEAFLQNNPDKIRHNKFKFLGHQMADYVGPYFKYGAITTKFIIGLAALAFMFFQAKYFGTLLIQKYQFLIKASCNQQCAEQLWSISTLWFFAITMTLAPLIPVMFYKKIYSNVSKSKNIQVINGTITETILLGAVGVFLLIGAAPTMLNSTTRYSKVLASYSNGTLQLKLSQKIEMASKRAFQGDVDDVEEVEVLQDQHEE